MRDMIDSREGFDAATEAEYNAYFDATERPMYYDDATECEYEFDDYEDDYDDSMDGDFDSAMRDAGWGTDEDYGYYGDDRDPFGDFEDY